MCVSFGKIEPNKTTNKVAFTAKPIIITIKLNVSIPRMWNTHKRKTIAQNI